MTFKVKPLEWGWDEIIGLWVARATGLNLYYHASNDGEWRRAERIGYPTKQAHNLTAAQAACQADYETRILSAIEVEE